MQNLPFEFHVSRKARDNYHFDLSLFASDGRVIVADFSAARQFAAQMSEIRGTNIPASDINAMGLIDEIMHIVIRQYEIQNPGTMARAVARMENSLGKVNFEKAQLKFLDEFPPISVYQKQVWAADYLNAYSNGRAHRQTTLEEMLLLYVTNLNPAVQPYKELFDDTPLKPAGYENVVKGLSDFFSGEPGLGGSGSTDTLIHVLRAPAIASPYSLEGQLQFLLQKWGVMLGEAFVQRLLRGLDFVKEEVMRGNFAGGFAGEISVMNFGGQDYVEYERFSPDKDWMPRLVLIAKNSYVWLDQLSKLHGREIRSLDAIPDEELDKLA